VGSERHDWTVTVEEARKLALALPEAVEQEHWGNPSFRVRGRIFATVPDERHLNVMIDPFDVEAAVREAPESCEELWWGKKLAGVRVALPTASKPIVEAFLHAAWKRKAPRQLST
jgi:hypothetical protein